MAKLMETVLYYNPGKPGTTQHVALMKSVLVRMGIRIKNIGQDQVMETVGYLAGLDGFEAVSQLPEHVPEIPVQVMVLKHFSERRLDELLRNLRNAGVPRIQLKAVLTEHNSGWTFYHLYEELKEEHEAMAAGREQ